MKRSLVKATVVALGSLLSILCACYLAYAFSTGITGQTKKNSLTAGCGAKVSGGGGCHGTNPKSSVQVLLSGPAALPLGTPGTYTISLTGTSPTSRGGCDIAVSSGTLSSSSSLLQLLNQELTHVSRIATPFAIEFSYVSNSPGAVTIYANGKDSTGWNWAPSLSIRVGPPPAPSLILPANGSSAVPTSTVLTWSGVQGASWVVEVSLSQSFGSALLHQDVASDTTYVIPEGLLANNTEYFWRVSATDPGGTSGWSQAWSFSTSLTAIQEVHGQIPADFGLEQNYPNPFNPTTGIRFQVPDVSAVKLVLFDVQGREVATLVDEVKQPGMYNVTWNAGGQASGVYFYQLHARSGARTFSEVRKLLLVR